MVECRVDRSTVSADLPAEFHERVNPASLSPRQPPVQRVFPGLTLHFETESEGFFEEVAPVESGVGLGDPFKLGPLVVGQWGAPRISDSG